MRSYTALGGRRQTGVEFDYATASLAGRHPDSKAGMVAITMLWIFGALTLGWVGYAIWARPRQEAIESGERRRIAFNCGAPV
jgi:threonine/homoserine/homoserine lactone efflux protein